MQLLGPKKSVDLNFEQEPIIVGDETVLGLCAAWTTVHPESPATVLLEAADIGACRAAALAVGVTPDRVVSNRQSLIEAVIETARANPAAPLVVSGRAQTIAVVRAALKNAHLNDRPTRAKAYWDENRTGLD